MGGTQKIEPPGPLGPGGSFSSLRKEDYMVFLADFFFFLAPFFLVPFLAAFLVPFLADFFLATLRPPNKVGGDPRYGWPQRSRSSCRARFDPQQKVTSISFDH